MIYIKELVLFLWGRFFTSSMYKIMESKYKNYIELLLDSWLGWFISQFWRQRADWPHHLVFVLVLFNSQSFLLVHICQHETDVGSEQVIHFVAQGRLAEELGAPDQVADGHVEVCVATGPVGDPCEGMSGRVARSSWGVKHTEKEIMKAPPSQAL